MKNIQDFEVKIDKIIKGLEEAYRKMIIFKKEKNSKVVVSENGKILEIDPNEMPPTTKYYRELNKSE